MQIINTRPLDRALVLSQHLSLAGFEVVNLPLLQLQALELDDELISQFEQFQQADCVVVVSPTAAQIGLNYYFSLGYNEHNLCSKNWVAVGKATHDYLAKYGISSLVPEVETSEGMLTLDIFKDKSQQTVAFWRGIGGRTFMMEQLVAQHCNILNMLLYNRILPDHDLMLYQQVKQGSVVLMTSEESWNNWLKLAVQHQWNVGQHHYIVLGDRVTQILKDYFLDKKITGKISTVYNLFPDTIINHLHHDGLIQDSSLNEQGLKP